MAPIELEPRISYLPLAIIVSHVTTVIYLISVVGGGLYRSFRLLTPAQDVRSRQARRNKLLRLFSGLAAVCLAASVYSSAAHAVIFYLVWADQRGIGVPDGFFGGNSSSTGSSEPQAVGEQSLAQVHLARWLTDTPIYRDALEIVAEKARRFWWGQQLGLGMASWSVLLAIEGQRRKIPALWAYVLLAQLVSLPFAQNLFYVALLLTPAPLPEPEGDTASRLASRWVSAVIRPKPSNWHPHPVLWKIILLSSYVLIFLVPLTAGTPSFMGPVLAIRLLSFAPLVLPVIAPASWGTIHIDHHGAYTGYISVFRMASVASFLLHGKATVSALAYSLPDHHYHRHMIRVPFDAVERSTWERTTSAIGKVLGSTAEHSVVAAAGRDVLLSALSLGLWAAVRALDTRDILASTTPFYNTHKAPATANSVTAKVPLLSDDGHDIFKAEYLSPGSEPPSFVSLSAAFDPDSPAAAVKQRRMKNAPKSWKPHQDDQPYEPPPSVRQVAVEATGEGDVLPADELDLEAAALAWGMTAVGGLGCGSAGVFGGECISR